MSAHWYYRILDQESGPYTRDEMRERFTSGEINENTPVKATQGSEWRLACRFPELLAPVIRPTELTPSLPAPRAPRSYKNSSPLIWSLAIGIGIGFLWLTQSPDPDPAPTAAGPYVDERLSIAQRELAHMLDHPNQPEEWWGIAIKDITPATQTTDHSPPIALTWAINESSFEWSSLRGTRDVGGYERKLHYVMALEVHNISWFPTREAWVKMNNRLTPGSLYFPNSDRSIQWEWQDFSNEQQQHWVLRFRLRIGKP